MNTRPTTPHNLCYQTTKARVLQRDRKNSKGEPKSTVTTPSTRRRHQRLSTLPAPAAAMRAFARCNWRPQPTCTNWKGRGKHHHNSSTLTDVSRIEPCRWSHAHAFSPSPMEDSATARQLYVIRWCPPMLVWPIHLFPTMGLSTSTCLRALHRSKKRMTPLKVA
jgi:hypothetical protein